MDNIKKFIIVGICLTVAILVFVLANSNKDTGINSINPEDMIWVKCTNGACNAEYEMNLKEYLVATKGSPENPMTSQPAVCKACGQPTLKKALKCSKCGSVFFYGQVRNGYPDKCPKCGFSERENR